MDLRYAVGLPTVGPFGDVRTLTELAVRAEEHGWDGVQLWDHLLYDEPGWPVASSTVAAAAIAARTSRVRVILTVALPRRQVQDVARDTAAIDALSGGRLTVLAVIGSLDREYADFGLDPDPRARGRALDERLDRLTGLWSQWRVARIPIWCGGQWPRRAGLRRAAAAARARGRGRRGGRGVRAPAVRRAAGHRRRGGGRSRGQGRAVRGRRGHLVGGGAGLVARRPGRRGRPHRPGASHAVIAVILVGPAPPALTSLHDGCPPARGR
jgi:alkanesulfonate monooxygenase SsuD/methylene tetrahydromethanopterin reductase-like flavin-dependent oxidoreductase (luciferase family)